MFFSILLSLLLILQLNRISAEIHAFTASRDAVHRQRTGHTVSYTHLDVYKRQVVCPTHVAERLLRDALQAP